MKRNVIVYTTYEMSEESMNEMRKTYPNEELEFKIYPILVSRDNGLDNPINTGFVKMEDAIAFFESEKENLWAEKLSIIENRTIVKEAVGKYYDSHADDYDL